MSEHSNDSENTGDGSPGSQGRQPPEGDADQPRGLPPVNDGSAPIPPYPWQSQGPQWQPPPANYGGVPGALPVSGGSGYQPEYHGANYGGAPASGFGPGPQHYMAAGGYPPASAPPGMQPPEERNVLGIISLVCAIIGFVFACIPGALIVGWVLLPIAFILSLVSLFLKGKKKGAGVAGLIISIVGTIVGVVVFLTVVATAFDDATSGGDFDYSTPAQPATSTPASPDATNTPSSATAEPTAEESAEAEAPSPGEGTRTNPLPIGSTFSQGDWEVTVNDVNLDATDEVMAENMFNEEPAEGDVYILVNVTVKYLGNDSEGAYPYVDVSYVTAGGNTRESYDTFAVAPDPLSDANTLYHGAEESGNVVLAAPNDSVEEGTLAISAGFFGDKVFFAVE